jgi:deoxyxylulose-5-phosphate synthase
MARLLPSDELLIARARKLASLRTADEIRGYETAKGTPGHYFDADTVATSYAIAFGRAAATINQLASLIEHLTQETK